METKMTISADCAINASNLIDVKIARIERQLRSRREELSKQRRGRIARLKETKDRTQDLLTKSGRQAVGQICKDLTALLPADYTAKYDACWLTGCCDPLLNVVVVLNSAGSRLTRVSYEFPLPPEITALQADKAALEEELDKLEERLCRIRKAEQEIPYFIRQYNAQLAETVLSSSAEGKALLEGIEDKDIEIELEKLLDTTRLLTD